MESGELSTNMSDRSLSTAVVRDAPGACVKPAAIEERIQKYCDRFSRFDDSFGDCDCAKAKAVESITLSGDTISQADLAEGDYINEALNQCP